MHYIRYKSDLMHGAFRTQSIIILWIVTVQLMLRLLLLPKKAFKSLPEIRLEKKARNTIQISLILC